MSLKAKIEAVIYASEEPVTLAQLIGLLGEEGQAELDTLAANQLSLDTGEFAAGDDAPEPEFAIDAEDAIEAADNNPEALNAEILQPADEAAETKAEAPVILSGDAEPQPASESQGPDAADATDTAEPLPASEATEATPDTRSLVAAEKLRTRKLRDYFRSLLDQLIADYIAADRGFEIKEVASGFRFATKPEYHDAVRGFVKSLKPPLKLSLQALETLAVVAYKQPVTAPEVSEIRGVESAGTLGSLLTRKLITTAGRKQVIGRPILYKTTKDFLLRFGLKDINELPSIEEFERMAGELNEAVQEEIQMEEHPLAETEATEAETASEETSETSTEETPAENATGGSPALDELHAVPEPTHILHDTPEDLLADDSTHPEGTKLETE